MAAKKYDNMTNAILKALTKDDSGNNGNLQHNLSLKNAEVKNFYFRRKKRAGDTFLLDLEYVFNGNTGRNTFLKNLRFHNEDLILYEEIMLSEALPAMENILKTAEIKKNKLQAKCLLHEVEGKQEFYVLENLNMMGYYKIDRIILLNFKQSELVMKKMAKFHAASMLYVKQNPDILNKLLKATHLEKDASNPLLESITYGGIEYVANMVTFWPSFYKDFSEKLRHAIYKFKTSMKDMNDSNMSKFNVINHGDLSVSNIILKYDEGNLKFVDAIFVNFQHCFWGSCGFDINYFLNTSLKVKYLKTQRQELIKAYYDTLCETLTQIKYPANEIPSQQDVLDEINRCELFGLYASICQFPIITMDSSLSDNFDLNIFTDQTQIQTFRQKLYNDKRLKKHLEYTLKYFADINVI